MKIHHKGFMILIWSFFAMLSFPYTSFASNESPFEISPIFTENQDKNVTGYYDIKVMPNETIFLPVAVKNNLNRAILVNITPLNATTSSFGDVIYDVNNQENQFVNLKVHLKTVGVSKQRIEIPPNTTINIPIEFKLPNVYEGTVVGGIHVIADNAIFSEDEIQNGNVSFKIKNQIAYIIGLKMQFPTLVDPEFSFGKTRVDIQHSKPKLLIEMKNSAAAVVKDLSGTYKVLDDDEKKVLEGSFSNMKMAPNTRFEYAVDWIEGKVRPGTYTVKLTAKVNGEEISADRKVTIKETKPIEEYNDNPTVKETDSSIPWWSYAVTVLAAGSIFFIIGRKSKKKKKYQRQKFDFLDIDDK